ncbi:MAG: 4-(cytidine 5'-diphospho)-2-C-methyl-D-erythritol kinase [Dethiobacteria bacterium]|jgi:4-diphosphocytidyl-2-C-methyl-D-erythritol kinase|nr:4-(cytidine 5'-diphospho)-2-C-methyl-D-erythritol kinase [Bacillota bacterium]HPZ40916.1 4-(cytidine 5'-diphospho)-2-C-methyl-D-erythritol kinase [Bacillota bacterium]
MNSVLTIKAPAKINLGLTVLRRRPDGYHDLSSVMQQISLADTIRLEPQREPGCSFYCSEPSLAGKDNLVCRAAALLVERAALGASLPGVKISLYKHIPAAAGLGGGSSDAAAALKALNVFWKLALSMEQLVEIGALLGSDIPYCLRGGTALVGGGGEKVTSLPALPFYWVILALPAGITLSTAQVYSMLEPVQFSRPPLAPLISAVREQREESLQDWFAGGLTNTLEAAVLPACSSLGTLKKEFLNLGLYPAMSGSGPAFFALTKNFTAARLAVRALQEAGNRAFLCWTIP